MRLYTIGHGIRSTEDLAGVLLAAGVPRVADVRRFPGSRRSPHLAREALERDLPALGIAYEWCGEDLGGRRRLPRGRSRHPAWRDESFRAYAHHMDTPAFRAALGRLLADLPVAVMCAETLWWRCHRRLIADAATLAGVEVVHLLDVGTAEPHRLHPAVRADAEGRPVYDVGVQRELL